MQLLSAASLDSSSKEAELLAAAWTGYQHVLKGRFHRGTVQLGKATAAAEGFPRIHASCLGLSGLAARLACHWDEVDRTLLAASREFATANDPERAGLMLALHVEALTAQGDLERAQANLVELGSTYRSEQLNSDLATVSLRIAQGKLKEAEDILDIVRQKLDARDARSADAAWWAKSFQAELLCDQRQYEVAEAVLQPVIEERLGTPSPDESLVRLLCQLVQARLGAAWQNENRRTPAWREENSSTLDKTRHIASGYPR